MTRIPTTNLTPTATAAATAQSVTLKDIAKKLEDRGYTTAVTGDQIIVKPKQKQDILTAETAVLAFIEFRGWDQLFDVRRSEGNSLVIITLEKSARTATSDHHDAARKLAAKPQA